MIEMRLGSLNQMPRGPVSRPEIWALAHNNANDEGRQSTHTHTGALVATESERAIANST